MCWMLWHTSVMAANADLITTDQHGNVDVLALMAAQQDAKRAARVTAAMPAQRSWERVSSFNGARSVATFHGMDGDLAVYTGINL